MRPTPPRRGYAMMLVLLFLMIFLSLLSIAYSQMGAALRAESVRVRQVHRDEGSIHALAGALALLETGFPPSDPYVCGVTINTSAGASSFTVTFASQGGSTWSVSAAPTGAAENAPPIPSTFAR